MHNAKNQQSSFFDLMNKGSNADVNKADKGGKGSRYPFVLKSCSCTTEVMLQMWQCNTFFVQLLVTMSLILSTQINHILNTNIFWTQVTHSVSHYYFAKVVKTKSKFDQDVELGDFEASC